LLFDQLETVHYMSDAAGLRSKVLEAESNNNAKRRKKASSNGLFVVGSKEGRVYVVDAKLRREPRTVNPFARTKIHRLVPVGDVAVERLSFFEYLGEFEQPSAVVLNGMVA
jgi:hypothetical protein